MAYIGLYTDRNPLLIAAGIKRDRTVNIKDCFVEASLADKVAALKLEFCPGDDEAKEVYPEPSVTGSKLYEGLDTDMAMLLTPPVKSQTDQFNDEFKETVYESYWNKPLGKRRDPTASLPQGFDPLATTLGIPTLRGPSVSDVVNPQKLPGQVLVEADIGHKMYVKTHKCYYPGEKVDRNYAQPPYNPRELYGLSMSGIKSGAQARACMRMPEGAGLLSKRQVDYKLQTHSQLGKAMEPNHVLGTLVTRDYAFGKPCTREMYGLPELLRECSPCLPKRDEVEYMSNINALRVALKKFKPPISFFDMKADFLALDQQKSGTVPLSTVYEVCAAYHISVDHGLLESLMRRLCAMSPDGQEVNYGTFVAMLDWKVHHFPEMTKIRDVPERHLYYESTYQAANKDLLLTDTSEIAGLPSARYDLGYTVTPISAYRDSLGDETTVQALVSPNIFTQFGLSHRDFLVPRDKACLQEVFTNIGVALPDDKMDALYQVGRDLDKTGGVCVETFRNLLASRDESVTGASLEHTTALCPC